MTTYAQYVKESFQKEYAKEKSADYDFGSIYRARLIEFRKVKDAIVRLEKPTNIPRARQLGYKAKKGFVVVRVRVRKGSGLHRRPSKGRRPKRMGVNKLTRRISIQGIAEKRANKKYPNCEVMNSYFIGEDGMSKYFEVILIDTSAPEILSDKEFNWITEPQHRNRAERGLTSAQKRSRGLHGKGKGYEKVRPSQRAHHRKAK